MNLIELINFSYLGDDRGSLIAIEGKKNIPFDIKRVYYIFGTQISVSRGFHAHYKLKQVAICIAGSCRFILDDGKKKEEVLLENPNQGLIIDNMIWHEMHDFSSDCILLVFADDFYKESDYIRDYNVFLKNI